MKEIHVYIKLLKLTRNHTLFNKPIYYRLSDIIERETEEFYKMDPDPFDDRHPGILSPMDSI